MGYYTFHNLEVKNITNNEFINLKKALEEKGIIRYALDEGTYSYINNDAYFCSWDSCKWYESDEDMCEISKLFPNSIFKLYCNGEDSDDFHNDYFVNGISEICGGRIVYDEPTICKWD